MKIVIEFNNPDFWEEVKIAGKEYCIKMNKIIDIFKDKENVLKQIIDERISKNYLKIYITNNIIGGLIKQYDLRPNNDIINIEEFINIRDIVKDIISIEKIKIITNDEFKKILNYIDIGYCKYLVIDVTKNYFTSKIY